MIAASGDRLLAPEAVGALRRVLIPRMLLITPNLPEAAALLDAPVARSETEMRDQAKALLDFGCGAVLIKGGHADGPESIDLLVDAVTEARLVADRVDTKNIHGTGCTLSSAIAAGLAKGLELDAAVREAKIYVTAAIAAADRLTVGAGAGPVHHFHGWWRDRADARGR
jgi:hydroxymethylpyrimidine/phosphomethylpyrimidine kinase